MAYGSQFQLPQSSEEQRAWALVLLPFAQPSFGTYRTIGDLRQGKQHVQEKYKLRLFEPESAARIAMASLCSNVESLNHVH